MSLEGWYEPIVQSFRGCCSIPALVDSIELGLVLLLMTATVKRNRFRFLNILPILTMGLHK